MRYLYMKKIKDELIELSDGSFKLSFKLDNLYKQMFYDAAIKENKLTLQDLQYQSKVTKNNFKEMVISAFILKCLKNELKKKKTNKRKSKK